MAVRVRVVVVLASDAALSHSPEASAAVAKVCGAAFAAEPVARLHHTAVGGGAPQPLLVPVQWQGQAGVRTKIGWTGLRGLESWGLGTVAPCCRPGTLTPLLPWHPAAPPSLTCAPRPPPP